MEIGMETVSSIDERYERLAVLAEDRVWQARDRDTGSMVALKRLDEPRPDLSHPDLSHPDLSHLDLSHPNVVTYLGLVQDGRGQTFSVMAYVDGGHLGSLRGGSVNEIVDAGRGLVAALSYVHGQGLVHRDLKASNVLRDRLGRVYLADFELARPAGDPSPSGGSRFALSPQQLRGEAAAFEDDLYALGALFYELWTGRPPFWPQASDSDILARRPASLAESRPDLPPPLVELTEALLDKEAARRPDLRRVRAVLDAHRAGMPAPSIGAAPRLRPPSSAPPSSAPPSSAALPLPPPPVPVPSTSMSTPMRSPRAPGSRAPELRDGFQPLPGSGTGMGRGAAALLALLALAAVVVIVLLPRWTAPSGSASAESVASETVSPEPFESTAPAPEAPSLSQPAPDSTAGNSSENEVAARLAARRAGEQVATGLQEAASRGARIWGAEPFAAAETQAEQGRELFEARHWTESELSFGEALTTLEAVEALRRSRVAELLEAGRQALASKDAATAQSHFEAVLDMEPSSEAGRAGLRRAERLPQVLALKADAAMAEQQGNWQRAAELYGRAAGLDPQSSDARQGAQRNRARAADDAFSRAMGQAFERLADLDAVSWQAPNLEALATETRQSFAAARALPGADAAAVDEGLAELKAVETRHALARLQSEGEGHEKAEQWRQAEAVYRRALALDGSLAFAQGGLERAVERAELSEAMDFHLARPDRLSSVTVLQEARTALGRAEQVSGGPEHARRLGELRRLVATYDRAVSGELISDGRTNVWIYKVGKLGAFQRRAVELRPGTYTVTGSREGFRDVRKQWVVQPGQAPEPLDIRCEEAL